MDENRVLFRWTPKQIAAMTKDEAQRVIDFHRNNPATMDYFTEFCRSQKEIELAKEQITRLRKNS